MRLKPGQWVLLDKKWVWYVWNKSVRPVFIITYPCQIGDIDLPPTLILFCIACSDCSNRCVRWAIIRCSIHTVISATIFVNLSIKWCMIIMPPLLSSRFGLLGMTLELNLDIHIWIYGRQSNTLAKNLISANLLGALHPSALLPEVLMVTSTHRNPTLQ